MARTTSSFDRTAGFDEVRSGGRLLLHCVNQGIGIERLGDETAGTMRQDGVAGPFLAVGRQHHDGYRRHTHLFLMAANHRDRVHAVHHRHVQIHQHDVVTPTVAGLDADEAGALLEDVELRSGLTAGVVLGPWIQLGMLVAAALLVAAGVLSRRRR